MKPLKNKAHRHKYEKITEWITSPTSPDARQYYMSFTVMRACECGDTKRGEPELSEIEEFIEGATCSGCGNMTTVKHGTQSDCIRDLHLRVKFLEDRLNKVCDALSGIGT